MAETGELLVTECCYMWRGGAGITILRLSYSKDWSQQKSKTGSGAPDKEQGMSVLLPKFLLGCKEENSDYTIQKQHTTLTNQN